MLMAVALIVIDLVTICFLLSCSPSLQTNRNGHAALTVFTLIILLNLLGWISRWI